MNKTLTYKYRFSRVLILILILILNKGSNSKRSLLKIMPKGRSQMQTIHFSGTQL